MPYTLHLPPVLAEEGSLHDPAPGVTPISEKPVTAVTPVTRLLEMPLDQFEREGCPIEIKVPGFLQTLWFVPRDSHRDALSRKGIGRGRIWTAHELIDLWRVPGVTKEHAKTLAGIKVEFEAEIVTIEPVVSQTPDPKDGTRA